MVSSPVRYEREKKLRKREGVLALKNKGATVIGAAPVGVIVISSQRTRKALTTTTGIGNREGIPKERKCINKGG